MPNLHWSELTPLQLGRYAEYYAKMEFASYGYEVYTSEVDDHGVDFIVKVPDISTYLEIQVKSIRNNGYAFMQKSHMQLSSNRVVCLLRFIEGALPEVYIIPATAWLTPNALLVDRNYDKEGQTSHPEWGINISNKNIPILKNYSADIILKHKI